jgi:hypothetical protein
MMIDLDSLSYSASHGIAMRYATLAMQTFLINKKVQMHYENTPCYAKGRNQNSITPMMTDATASVPNQTPLMLNAM